MKRKGRKRRQEEESVRAIELKARIHQIDRIAQLARTTGRELMADDEGICVSMHAVRT